jgi:hypothetical protein
MFVDETVVGDRMIKADGVFAILTATIKSTAPDGLSEITVANEGAFADYDLNLIDAAFVSGGVKVGEEVVEPTETPDPEETPTPTDPPVTELPDGFAVIIDTVTGKAGDTVEIPIRFKDVPSSGINNCDFRVNYDDSILTIEKVDVGPLVTGGREDFGANIVKGDSRVAFMFVDETGVGDRMIKSDGVFAILTATISETAPEGLTVIKVVNEYAFADYDLNLIDAAFVDGGVKVGEEVIQPVDGNTISGYIAPDFLYDSSVKAELLSGYRVEVEGTELYAITDSNGYFEISEIPGSEQGYTLTITKQFYITRNIDVVVNDDDVQVSTLSSPILIWAGDFVEDGVLNMSDIAKVGAAFNTTSGNDRFNGEVDINKDGAVNMEDIVIIVKNFGKNSSDYSR